MNKDREYEIAFVGLKPGVHEFNYPVDDTFFEGYQKQEFSNCQSHVKLLLEKNNGFMLLKFEVGGIVQVNCDRCGNNLPFDLFDEFRITVKIVDEPDMMNEQEEDPDVYYISKGETHLHVKDWIYEFVNLSIPMQKTCSYENMEGPFCNKAAKDLLLKLEPEKKEQENPGT